MKRAAPYLLFGALTLAVFWRFLFLGQTIYVTGVLESHLGWNPREPGGWFRADPPHGGVADNLLLLPLNLGIYNAGLKAGELRLWNPYLFCGYPVYSDPMVHPFYPPTLLLHAALPPRIAFETGLLVHFFFSGAAMFWLLGALGRSRPASAAGGAVWMLLGYNGAWFSTGILMGVSVYGPLALWAVVRGLGEQRLSFASLGGAFMGLGILSSHPQHALNVFLFLAAWLAAAILRSRGGRKFAARFSILFAILAVGTGLAAILTRLETIASGSRGLGDDFENIYGWARTSVRHLFTLVLGKALFPERAPLEFEFTCFAGLGAAGLALLGAVRGFREPAVRFASLAAACILVIVFVPPVAGLFRHIPILNLSPPTRWLYLFGFALVLLASRGWDELPRAPRWAPYVPAAAAVLLALVLAAGVDSLRGSNGAAVETVLGFALVAAAAFAVRSRPGWAPAAAGAAILFELLPLFLQFNRHWDPRVIGETPAVVRFAQEREKEPWRGTGALGRPFSLAEAIFLPEFTIGNNSLALYGVENPVGFEAVFPAPYARFCREAGALVATSGRVIFLMDYSSPLLDLAGLKYLFMPFDLKPPARFRLLGQWDQVKLYENTAALPRAWVVAGAVVARDEDESARLLRDPGFRPREAVVIETPVPLDPRPPGPVEARIEWKERTSDRLTLEVTAEKDGFLVLADADYPGWEASVDGRPVPIHRANLAFRAVELGAGRHTVQFAFRPEPARIGMRGTLVFLALAAALAAWRRRKETVELRPAP